MPNKGLGASKVFKCPNAECRKIEARDGGAARKIFILFVFGSLTNKFPTESDFSQSGGHNAVLNH